MLDKATELTKFYELVDVMTEEYKTEEGNITCEFSTNELNLGYKLRYLATKEKQGVTWNLYHCDTCVAHNKETPFHVKISGFSN